MKVIALIQVRMNSTRLPKKAMLKLDDTSVIEFLLKRLKLSKEIDEIVVATTKNKADKILVKHVEDLGIKVFEGSETNVLDRFYKAAKKFNADVVIRITGDCPLIDPFLIDEMLKKFLGSDLDYLSNCFPPSYPDGLDTEIFTFETLKKTWEEANTDHELEHVTPYMYETKNFKVDTFKSDVDLKDNRWTVDEKEDLEFVNKVLKKISPKIDFTWEDVLKVVKKNPDLKNINSHIARNVGSKISSGEKLWKRAKKVIPGGNMLFSKRPDLFLQNGWPSYFSKAKGIEVWDLDGKKFKDFSLMGVGTNILGYGNEIVDEAVKENLLKGNMSTLNCPEEVLLAERLVELNPWADMVRFARSGGEANAIAIRIARAASSRDKIAVCGYHGWHDWYLSANLDSDKNLSEHLLPGLIPAGVPRSLEGTTIPFLYNDFDSLEKIIQSGEVGVVKMEVFRTQEPKKNFLKKVRDLCDENEIILIFDECTSGFRKTFGGLHLDYGVDPDMAMFGKALGNGYAITAVVGRKEIMDYAQSTFISSTFWTERIGPSAAIACLEEMQNIQSWKIITNIGSDIKKRWISLSKKYDLDLNVYGLDALAGFTFPHKDNLKYKTYVTQEMLKKGFLANNLVYCSICHKDEEIEEYFEALEPIFEKIRECQVDLNIDSILDSGPSSSDFKRLN